jgi:dihydrofolate synthase/folylpolyglutamate synthase
MFRKVSQMADIIILTRPAAERGLDPERFGADSPGISVISDPGEALQTAFSLAGPWDLICATGSLYLIAGVRKLVLQKHL